MELQFYAGSKDPSHNTVASVITVKTKGLSRRMIALDELWSGLHDPDNLVERCARWCLPLEKLWSDKGDTKDGHTSTPISQFSSCVDRARVLVLCTISGHSPLNNDEALRADAGDLAESKLELSPDRLSEMEALLRVTKNLLRWNLQVLQPFSSGKDTIADAVVAWREKDSLRLLLNISKCYCATQADIAQHASQMFFYSTYSTISGSDLKLNDTVSHLLEEFKIMQDFLICIYMATDAKLLLSLLKNVHNIMGSFPKGKQYAEYAGSQCKTTETQGAPWSAENSELSFRCLIPRLALWCLKEKPPLSDHANKAHLVLEAIRICYAMRLSADAACGDDVVELAAGLLELGQRSMELTDECRKDSVLLLLDARSDVLRRVLLKGALPALVVILDEQASEVLSNDRIDDSAAAMLSPILVTLHKICSQESDTNKSVKRLIFSQEQEDLFQERLYQEKLKGKVKNMRPLVQPKDDSLHYKMVKLLSWPQGHVKRFAGELLWVLCDRSSPEFIGRVGMGNGVTLLSGKGILKVPIQS